MMKEPIKFKCPRCGCEANAYSQVMAGCVNCGVLPYTDIPQEVKSQLTKRPANGGELSRKPVRQLMKKHSSAIVTAQPSADNNI